MGWPSNENAEYLSSEHRALRDDIEHMVQNELAHMMVAQGAKVIVGRKGAQNVIGRYSRMPVIGERIDAGAANRRVLDVLQYELPGEYAGWVEVE